MEQKIIQVGNSLAITLPARFIRETGWKAGDLIAVEHDAGKKIAVITSKDQKEKAHLTPEFFQWLEETSKKYEAVIVELSHR